MNNKEKYALPKGFLCSGIKAGLKEDKTRKDLGLIYTEHNAILGGVYTKNMFPSAHVQYCRKLTPSDSFRTLIINSGNANAGNGKAGIKANLQLTESLARLLKIDLKQVFTSSTGIIGHPFPIDTIEAALQPLVDNLKAESIEVAEAIMTTDLKPKIASKKVKIADEEYTVTGFAKGSGMIHPNMATMLSYVLTDAPLAFANIQDLTRKVADRSFNRVSIDGDTSTNDSFYLISSNPVDSNQETPKQIEDAITEVAISLAKQIAADGEGAEHLIEIQIQGAKTEEICKAVLNAILTSNLVKTAINGRDPNWGRILMAMGNGLTNVSTETNPVVSISIQSTPVLVKGEPSAFDAVQLSKKMSEFEVKIDVNLHSGEFNMTGWGCDFSVEYVRINADYST